MKSKLQRMHTCLCSTSFTRWPQRFRWHWIVATQNFYFHSIFANSIAEFFLVSTERFSLISESISIHVRIHYFVRTRRKTMAKRMRMKMIFFGKSSLSFFGYLVFSTNYFDVFFALDVFLKLCSQCGFIAWFRFNWKFKTTGQCAQKVC